jgi:cytochrome P450
VLTELRQAVPVQRVNVLGLQGWLVTRYDDVLEALANPAISVDPQYAKLQVQAWPLVAAALHGPIARSMVTTDDPDHARLRRLVAKEFTPRRVQAMQPRIEQVCDELIAGFQTQGHADLIREYSSLLPVTIISEMLGVPKEDGAQFRRWSLIVIGAEEHTAAEQPRAWAELGSYLTDLIEHKARSGGQIAETDLLGALISVRDGTDRLSNTELLGMATVLLLGGFGTTLNLIANAVLTLHRHPDQLAALNADPALVDSLIEETLRYEGPIAIPSLRYTRQPVRIGDTTIPANEVVLLSLASANRDPDRYHDPDNFDLSRARGQGHLGFGHGIHYCIGAPLARLEARIAIPKLLAACPDLAIDHTEEIRWRVTLLSRALVRLPVTFTPTVPVSR